MTAQTKKTAAAPAVKLSREQLHALIAELQQSTLSRESTALLITILNVFTQLQSALENKTIGLVALLRRIFGLKTERYKSPTPENTPAPSPEPDDKKKEKAAKAVMA